MRRGPATEIMLNGRACTWNDGCQQLRPWMNRDALICGGGMLLKAALQDDTLLLYAQPNFIDGQRTYHYDMPLGDGAGPALSGDISPNGTISLVFAVEALRCDKLLLRRTCLAAARALLDAGLDRRCEVSPVSARGLVEAGVLDAPPATLGELSK